MVDALRLSTLQHLINQMTTSNKLFRVLQLLLVASVLLGANSSEAEICSELSGYFANNQTSKLHHPARQPTKDEAALIKKSKSELLENIDYAMGVDIVDADNDGKDDVWIWAIQGSGRFGLAELYELPVPQSTPVSNLTLKVSTFELGVLREPFFIRHEGVNYVAYTETGGNEGTTLSQIIRTANGKYQQRTVCHMQTVLKVETSCRHPACKKLTETVENKSENAQFTEIAWAHKYFAPNGLEVYFPESGSQGDWDNTGNPTSIWRIGRDGYIFQHIGWSLLGQGETMPNVDAKQRPLTDDITTRAVLAGHAHDRLRHVLTQQSEVLSQQLHQSISLPNQGNFFLFNAHNNRTYWAWDFGEQPFGEEIHVIYTNAKKSDYIGRVSIKRNFVLQPCASDCISPLEP
jgi:hypothetical protein